ncbi:MAG: biopolymer transporter ExbD [Elusimicrobia bacterium]|nr:biopolymer transporter ExbD [Elusimicrobiota bacterium]
MAGSPFHKDDEAAPISDVNVVPLADVSLVLLIILLVLSPMAAQSMLKVQAAAAKAEAALPTQVELLTMREPEAVVVLGVTALGFVMDGRLMATGSELTEFLKLKLSVRTDRKVFVSPELEVAHGQVIAALEAVQAAGGTVALVQVVDPEAR